MGKIKRFFGKIWNGIKSAGRFVKNKALPFVGRLLKPVLNVVSALPGKIGMIGKVGSVVHDVASDVIKQIPNKDTRDKIQGVVDHSNDKFQGVVDRGRQYAQTGNDMITTIRNGANRVGGLLKPAVLTPQQQLQYNTRHLNV